MQYTIARALSRAVEKQSLAALLVQSCGSLNQATLPQPLVSYRRCLLTTAAGVTKISSPLIRYFAFVVLRVCLFICYGALPYVGFAAVVVVNYCCLRYGDLLSVHFLHRVCCFLRWLTCCGDLPYVGFAVFVVVNYYCLC